MLRTIGLILTLQSMATIALAQSSADPLEACAQKSDANARLACFDQEMQRRHTTPGATTPAAGTSAPTASAGPAAAMTGSAATTAPPASAPAAKVSAAAANTAATDNVGLDGVQLQRKLKEQGAPKPEPVKPIVATLTRMVPRPQEQYLFVLDNGQTWEQAESKAHIYVQPNEIVTIEPGLLGSFFLTTPEHDRIRIHRIR